MVKGNKKTGKTLQETLKDGKKKGSPGGTVGADGKAILGTEKVASEPEIDKKGPVLKDLGPEKSASGIISEPKGPETKYAQLMRTIENLYKEGTRKIFGDGFIYDHKDRKVYRDAQIILLERGFLAGEKVARY